MKYTSSEKWTISNPEAKYVHGMHTIFIDKETMNHICLAHDKFTVIIKNGKQWKRYLVPALLNQAEQHPE